MISGVYPVVRTIYNTFYYATLVAEVRKLWDQFTHEWKYSLPCLVRQDSFITNFRKNLDYTQQEQDQLIRIFNNYVLKEERSEIDKVPLFAEILGIKDNDYICHLQEENKIGWGLYGLIKADGDIQKKIFGSGIVLEGGNNDLKKKIEELRSCYDGIKAEIDRKVQSIQEKLLKGVSLLATNSFKYEIKNRINELIELVQEFNFAEYFGIKEDPNDAAWNNIKGKRDDLKIKTEKIGQELKKFSMEKVNLPNDDTGVMQTIKNSLEGLLSFSSLLKDFSGYALEVYVRYLIDKETYRKFLDRPALKN